MRADKEQVCYRDILSSILVRFGYIELAKEINYETNDRVIFETAAILFSLAKSKNDTTAERLLSSYGLVN